MASSFDIFPVTAESAVAWASGKIHDSQLDRTRGEVVFWNELLEISAYRSALLEIARLKLTGCRAMIVHACHPAVWHKLDREGCVCSFREQIVWRGCPGAARRYIVTPVVFAHWIEKWNRKT